MAAFLICCFTALLIFSACPVKASGNIQPAAMDNLKVRLKSTSKLVVTDSGYMRVFYDGEKIGIEYYDNSFHIQKKKSLAMELGICLLYTSDAADEL
mgnify:CR=1 FL=1